jgi:hypothetical protein
MKRCFWIAALLMVVTAAAASANAADNGTAPRFTVEVESGPVWQSRNDVQIPNTADGTRFALDEVVGAGPWPTARVYATWNVNSRHSLRALAAPFSITETGTLPSKTLFEGGVFEPGTPAEATYQFNSWRVTYRYRFHDGARWAWRIGFTAKIRDAKIELRQGDISAEKTDLGFVPLLHVYGSYSPAERLHVVFDIDALAGGPGRAEDAAIKIQADMNTRWSVAAGYRTVEGGADVDSVYNFAWLHYAVLSLTCRL